MSDPYFKFYPTDWKADDQLKFCSAAARGVWIEMLCICHNATPYGHFLIDGISPTDAELTVLTGIPTEQITQAMGELESRKIFSRTAKGVIYSRKLVRDEKKRREGKKNGSNGGGNPLLKKGTVPKNQRVRGYRRSDSPEKTERIFQKKEGKCWWCDCQLDKENFGPNFFHVDHLVAICDGGTNDEANLVPSCASCNHSRARKDWENPSDNKGGINSDNNTQIPIPESSTKKKEYRFKGKVVRLTAKDWEALRGKTGLSEDGFLSWICSKDDYYSTLAEHERAEWWMRLNGAIRSMKR